MGRRLPSAVRWRTKGIDDLKSRRSASSTARALCSSAAGPLEETIARRAAALRLVATFLGAQDAGPSSSERLAAANTSSPHCVQDGGQRLDAEVKPTMPSSNAATRRSGQSPFYHDGIPRPRIARRRPTPALVAEGLTSRRPGCGEHPAAAGRRRVARAGWASRRGATPRRTSTWRRRPGCWRTSTRASQALRRTDVPAPSRVGGGLVGHPERAVARRPADEPALRQRVVAERRAQRARQVRARRSVKSRHDAAGASRLALRRRCPRPASSRAPGAGRG